MDSGGSSAGGGLELPGSGAAGVELVLMSSGLLWI